MLGAFIELQTFCFDVIYEMARARASEELFFKLYMLLSDAKPSHRFHPFHLPICYDCF